MVQPARRKPEEGTHVVMATATYTDTLAASMDVGPQARRTKVVVQPFVVGSKGPEALLAQRQPLQAWTTLLRARPAQPAALCDVPRS